VKELERRLRNLRAPDESAVALRAWELASVEFGRREPRPRSHRRRALVLVVAALCISALFISPAGAGVVRWVGDRFDAKPGVKHAKPFLGPLPAQGRLLVASDAGVWVVQRDGSKRLLGRYADPAWSPHGLFIAATRAHELVAMEPNGRVHWTVPASSRPLLPRWSSDGYRIAYFSGLNLRVVVGNGTGDHLFAAHVEEIAPAWRPGPDHVLAFAARGGVTAADVDLGTTLFRVRAPSAQQLAWSPSGTLLLVVERRRLRLFDSRGRVRKELDLPTGTAAERAAFSPDGRTIALLRRQSGLSAVRLLSVRGHSWHERAGAPVSGAFSTLDWSPDGRWLLLAWPAADQWLFVSPSRVLPVSGIGRAFASGPGWAFFPTVGGWSR
jgi:hypothetical protein